MFIFFGLFRGLVRYILIAFGIGFLSVALENVAISGFATELYPARQSSSADLRRAIQSSADL